MKLSDVLLGLVRLHPGVSGYELRKIISQSTQYFVNARLSQIYPALKQMTAEGLMTYGEDVTEGGRTTKRYTLTESGEKRFMAWLREPLDYALSMNTRRLFMLKLTFVGALPHDEQVDYVRDALDYFRYERDELMEGHLELETNYLDAETEGASNVLWFWQREIDHILASEDQLIAWLDGLLRDLEVQKESHC